MFDLKNEEILTYLLLIVFGYCIAKMFSNSCERFRIGVQGPEIPPCPECENGCDYTKKCLDPPQPPQTQNLENFDCPFGKKGRYGPGGTTSDGSFNYDNCIYQNFYECYRNECINAGDYPT
jgi:hypothetical protein